MRASKTLRASQVVAFAAGLSFFCHAFKSDRYRAPRTLSGASGHISWGGRLLWGRCSGGAADDSTSPSFICRVATVLLPPEPFRRDRSIASAAPVAFPDLGPGRGDGCSPAVHQGHGHSVYCRHTASPWQRGSKENTTAFCDRFSPRTLTSRRTHVSCRKWWPPDSTADHERRSTGRPQPSVLPIYWTQSADAQLGLILSAFRSPRVLG